MAPNQDVDRFNKLVQQCLNYLNKDSFAKTGNKDINFDDIRDKLNILKYSLSVLNVSNISLIPKHDLAILCDKINENFVLGALKAIDEFDINGIDSHDARNSLADRLSEQLSDFLNVAHSWITYFSFATGDINVVSYNLTRSLQAADQIINNNTNKSNEQLAEGNMILESLRSITAQGGISAFAEYFSEEARRYSGQATKWIYITSGFALFTFIFYLLFTYIGLFKPEIVNNRDIQLIVSKVLVVLIFGSATLWCAKIYKSLKHLEVATRHRALSLKTFQAFVNAAGDDASTKNAVLLETTRAIFAISNSGLIEGNETNEGGLKVLEIVKSLAGTKPNG